MHKGMGLGGLPPGWLAETNVISVLFHRASPESLGQGGLVHRRGGLGGLLHAGSQGGSLLCAAGLPGGSPLACAGQHLGCLQLLHNFRQQPGRVSHTCHVSALRTTALTI